MIRVRVRVRIPTSSGYDYDTLVADSFEIYGEHLYVHLDGKVVALYAYNAWLSAYRVADEGSSSKRTISHNAGGAGVDHMPNIKGKDLV